MEQNQEGASIAKQGPSPQELEGIRSPLAGDAAAVLGWLLERVEEWGTDEPELCPGAPESKPRRRALRPPVGARCRRQVSDRHRVGHGQLWLVRRPGAPD